MNRLVVPLVAMEGYSPKFTIFTFKKDANMVVMGKVLRAPTLRKL
jgi:hypothetical protein